MRRVGILSHNVPLHFGKTKTSDVQIDSALSYSSSNFLRKVSQVKTFLRANIPSDTSISGLASTKINHTFRHAEIYVVADDNIGEISEEDDELCPVDCVREFRTDDELSKVLEKSKETKSLVVVDFYRTACGSCKYIEQGFAKLCKGSGDQDAAVIFLKHNVIDEYDEPSEVSEWLRIKAVPLFHFYKDGVLMEAFPTRDKERIDAAIHKYTSSPPSEES